MKPCSFCSRRCEEVDSRDSLIRSPPYLGVYILLLALCVSGGFVRAAESFTNGIVSSAHPLATEAGLNVLKSSGNAIDAAVAIGFTLGIWCGAFSFSPRLILEL